MTVAPPIRARPTARVPVLAAGRVPPPRHADERPGRISPGGAVPAGGSLPVTAVQELAAVRVVEAA